MYDSIYCNVQLNTNKKVSFVVEEKSQDKPECDLKCESTLSHYSIADEHNIYIKKESGPVLQKENKSQNRLIVEEKEVALSKRSTESRRVDNNLSHCFNRSSDSYSLKDCIDYISLATNGSALSDSYLKPDYVDICAKSSSSTSKSNANTMPPNISSKCNFIESKTKIEEKSNYNSSTQNKIELNLNSVPANKIDKCLEGLNSFIKSSLRRMSNGGNSISINI